MKKSKNFAQTCRTGNMEFFPDFVSNKIFHFQGNFAKWHVLFVFKRKVPEILIKHITYILKAEYHSYSKMHEKF